MSASSAPAFSKRTCVPCEGGVPVIPPDQAADYLRSMPNWKLSDNGGAITRKINTGNFPKAVEMVSENDFIVAAKIDEIIS